MTLYIYLFSNIFFYLFIILFFNILSILFLTLSFHFFLHTFISHHVILLYCLFISLSFHSFIRSFVHLINQSFILCLSLSSVFLTPLGYVPPLHEHVYSCRLGESQGPYSGAGLCERRFCTAFCIQTPPHVRKMASPECMCSDICRRMSSSVICILFSFCFFYLFWISWN